MKTASNVVGSSCIWRVLALGIAMAGASRAVEVCFNENEYVTVAGAPVELGVKITYSPGEAPDLFSYGVRLVVSGGGPVVVTFVDVPPELNFTGFAPGATLDLDPGVMGVKGNTQFTGGEFQSYSGALLATFTLEGLAPGVVDLGLELYRTVGSSEDVFLTTGGTVLDDAITFGTATLTVSPPPVLEVTRLDAGTVRVRYQMVAGQRYRLRRSEDLVEWELMAETVGGASTAASFDFSTTASGRAFFRLEVAPDGA